MVSLKSFKLINDGDEFDASKLSEINENDGHITSRVYTEEDNNNINNNNNQHHHHKFETNYKSMPRPRKEANMDASQQYQATPTNAMDRPSNNQQDNLIESPNAVVSITLPSSQRHQHQHNHNKGNDTTDNDSIVLPTTPSSPSISIIVVTHDGNNMIQNCSSKNPSADDETFANDATSSTTSQSFDEKQLSENLHINNTNPMNHMQQSNKSFNDTESFGSENDNKYSSSRSSQVYKDNLMNYSSVSFKVGGQQLGSPLAPDMASRLSVTTESDHFEIVWSELCYRIEPKWYKKFNYVDQVISYFSSQTVDNHSSATSTASSSAGMNDNQHQMHSTTNNVDCQAMNGNGTQKSGTEPIEIFANLNGTIKSGQMTAVLGPSGAGKTTLLNCLTGKLRKGVSGHINLKGANGKHLKMCTIPQKDHLLELLTVEENLWFASKIKNPEYGFDHAKNIERVIDLLGLKRCRSAKIGKISGGQHKRVSIAQELLSNPDILVLDEPTSGLDSLTCYKTISMLRDLVELSANNDFMKPMAIIVTIHQPQPKVFNLFHHVYILANGGRVIYEGSPEQSLSTITQVTGLKPLDSTNSKPDAAASSNLIDPASFLIEIASEEYGADVINTLSDYQRGAFHERNDARNLQRQLHRAAKNNQNASSVDIGHMANDNFAFTPDFVPNQKDVVNISETEKTSLKQHKISDNHLDSSNNNNNDNSSNSTTSQNSEDEEDPNLFLSEQLLYTRTPNHKGRFWSHTATLTHRTLLTIRRDPLLMTSRIIFHLMIPILMGHVYGKATGAANACPHYEPEIDITQIPSLVEGKRIEYMLEELHMSIENVSMFFIIMYAFAAAVLALNALSFPLNMQVLLKETRNGWYSMSSYVVAKTLADLPLELTMPCLTMLLVYPMTGQPSSYLQWRMFTICLIMTLCSLIAQTQALILGALVMNSVQTAVFVSQASQLPWVILAGFTIRIKRLSEPLKWISLTSFYRLGCEAITLTRYGFGICPCDPQEITGEPVRLVGIPDQLRTVAQYWLDSMEASKSTNDTFTDGDDNNADLITTTTTMAPTTIASVRNAPKTDIFQHLANQLSYANSYGVNITSCDDVAPDRIRAINLGDNWLVARIWHLVIMLIIMKILLYYAVRFSIGIRL